MLDSAGLHHFIRNAASNTAFQVPEGQSWYVSAPYPVVGIANHRTAPSPPSPSVFRTFTSSEPSRASTIAQRRKHRDPYALAQARARKAANLSRQEVLKQERSSALGDPVRGTTTEFVRSFDTALPSTPGPPSGGYPSTATQPDTIDPTQPPTGPNAEQEAHLNFFLSPTELSKSIDRSKYLTTPLTRSLREDYISVETPEQKEEYLRQSQSTAREALQRIASLSIGSSKDRLRVNKQRCIDVFGRHHTDAVLLQRPSSATQHEHNVPEKTPRIGTDTGSSEVQIGILTAKIRTLADYLDTRGKTDKVNKRNLRLLVHRRQKLLTYLRRKERGGPRWQHVIETLGLTEGTWKGEISL